MSDISRFHAVGAVVGVATASLLLAAACGSTPPTETPAPAPVGSADITSEVRRILATDTAIPGLDSLSVHPEVAAFYEDSTRTQVLWVDDDGPMDRARTLERVVLELRDEAIRNPVVMSGALTQALDAVEGGSSNVGDLARAELLTSLAFVTAAADLSDGRVDPTKVVGNWKVERSHEAGVGLLKEIEKGADPREVFDGLRPKLPWYRYTTDALSAHRKVAASGGWPTVDLGGMKKLEVGQEADAVLSVRARFEAGVDETERELAGRNTGSRVYDESLADAVKHFQKRHALKDDGVVGPSTVKAMNVPVAERIADLELALEQMRWLPNDLGPRAIFVNVAGFELHVLENNESVLSMGVVVGKPEWPTVLFSDTLEHIVVNPYWHVPTSIERSEILPAVRRNPGYLAANNMVVVPAGNNFGSPVNTAGWDWSTQDMSKYDFRQEPGPTNALGTIKFLFPNEHNIYLHDTPATAKFAESVRAFSHGCVRLERPHELGRYIFEKATSRSASDLDRMLASKKRTDVGLTQKIPVHLFYMTAWASEDGAAHFHPDIYERNARFHSLLAGETDA